MIFRCQLYVLHHCSVFMIGRRTHRLTDGPADVSIYIPPYLCGTNTSCRKVLLTQHGCHSALASPKITHLTLMSTQAPPLYFTFTSLSEQCQLLHKIVFMFDLLHFIFGTAHLRLFLWRLLVSFAVAHKNAQMLSEEPTAASGPAKNQPTITKHVYQLTFSCKMSRWLWIQKQYRKA